MRQAFIHCIRPRNHQVLRAEPKEVAGGKETMAQARSEVDQGGFGRIFQEYWHGRALDQVLIGCAAPTRADAARVFPGEVR